MPCLLPDIAHQLLAITHDISHSDISHGAAADDARPAVLPVDDDAAVALVMDVIQEEIKAVFDLEYI